MSESIDTIRAQLWEKMRKKPYRDAFVAAHLSTNIVAQIQTLRELREWSQKDLAEEAGMSPSRISVMEDPSYDKFTLSTLKRLASAFDVALIAKFVEFSDLVNWVADLSPGKLEVADFEHDVLGGRPNARPASPRPISTDIESKFERTPELAAATADRGQDPIRSVIGKSDPDFDPSQQSARMVPAQPSPNLFGMQAV